MKIKVTENTKTAFYMSEMECIKVAEKYFKEYGTPDATDLNTLANFVGCYDIFKVEAEYAKNKSVYDAFGEGSGWVDVWVKIIAYNDHDTFVIVGAYLTDIWQIRGTNEEVLKSRMYIRTFTEDK